MRGRLATEASSTETGGSSRLAAFCKICISQTQASELAQEEGTGGSARAWDTGGQTG